MSSRQSPSSPASFWSLSIGRNLLIVISNLEDGLVEHVREVAPLELVDHQLRELALLGALERADRGLRRAARLGGAEGTNAAAAGTPVRRT